MANTIPFDSIRERAAQGYIRGLCERWLPGGTVKGDWWVVRVPWRADKTPSLGVSLTSGNWQDFGRPGDHGDITALYQKLKGCSTAEAARAVAICVSHPYGETGYGSVGN